MPVFSRNPTVLACALAAAGLGAALPAQAEMIYARLQPAVQTSAPTIDVNVSNDGRTVVFVSGDQQWVPGSSTASEVYAYDFKRNRIDIVSIVQNPPEGANSSTAGVRPSVSDDGRYVAYLQLGGAYDSGTLTGWHVVRKDRETGLLQLATSTSAGAVLGNNDNEDDATSISGNGRYVGFVSSSPLLGTATNQVFLKDMDTGAVTLVSAQMPSGAPSTSDAVMGSHAISQDGRYVVFKSPDPLLPGVTATGQIYVRDTVNNTTELVSRQSGANGQPSTTGVDYAAISPNGRFVVFKAYFGLGAPANYSGVYLRDRVTHTSISIPTPSVLPSGSACYGGDVSDVGTVFIQCGSPGQAFLWAPGFDAELASYGSGGSPGATSSGNTLAINANSLSMAFESSAALDPADTNGVADVYVHIDSYLAYGIFRDGFED
jgi:hypothetical protein